MIFEIEGRLGSGGSLFVNGKLAQGSLLEAYSVLEKINIGSFTPYVPSDLNDLEGLLSGNVSFLRGDEDRLEFGNHRLNFLASSALESRIIVGRP